MPITSQRETARRAWTPGPWEYVEGTKHHGPYVAGPWGGDICDCYAMSNYMAASIRNGGTSFPINHQGEEAEANARLIAAAPELLEAASALIACDTAENWNALRSALSRVEVDHG